MDTTISTDLAKLSANTNIGVGYAVTFNKIFNALGIFSNGYNNPTIIGFKLIQFKVYSTACTIKSVRSTPTLIWTLDNSTDAHADVNIAFNVGTYNADKCDDTLYNIVTTVTGYSTNSYVRPYILASVKYLKG